MLLMVQSPLDTGPRVTSGIAGFEYLRTLLNLAFETQSLDTNA